MRTNFPNMLMPFGGAAARAALATVLILLTGCSAGDEKKADDNGGDHIPDGKVYAVTALPDGTAPTGLAARETHADFLRRFVHVSQRYEICLDPSAFDDDLLTEMQAEIEVRRGPTKSYGLEGIVNRALATVAAFSPGAKASSSRVEIALVHPEGGVCHLLVTRATSSEFPFSNDDFKAKDRVLLYKNQLRTAAGAQNGTPVAYLLGGAEGLGDKDLLVATQYVIGRFLGLGESKLEGSNLSAATSDATAGRGYMLENDAGRPRSDDDAVAIYGFALVYRDAIPLADLDTFQHFEDQARPSDSDQDADLTMPAHPANAAFALALGNPYIEGARLVGGTDHATLKVCMQNKSGIAIADDRVDAYLSFIAPTVAASVVGILHAQEARFSLVATVAADSCSLIVSFKNATQYPFVANQVNGLYAAEGTVKDSTGTASALPVIYLDAAALELDPAAQGSSSKSIALVLHHEFAHFLGFKHSTSSDSILAPAGYNTGWDLAGGDDKIFDAYLKEWSAHQ